MAIDSLVNMQQMFGSPTPDPVGQSLQAGLGQQRAVISNNIAQDKLDKNQKLSLMLYALGGALKGDENFVQNTIKIQQMQEGKKKERAKKAKYDDFIKGLPEGSFKDLSKAIGYEKLDQLLLERYKAEQPKPVDPSKAIKQEELNVVMALKEAKGNIDELTAYQRVIYDNFIKRDNAQSILEQFGIVGDTDLIIEKVEG